MGDTIIESEYKLGPGDQIEANLIVGDNAAAVDHKFVVGPDGKIYFPRVGEIYLLGLTVPEAKELIDYKISEIYKEDYVFSFRLNQPRKIKVYLTSSDSEPLYVSERKFVSVYGDVARRGRYEYLPNKGFSDYISYAGGPNDSASLSAATVTRGKHKYYINGSKVIFDGDRSEDIEIMPGDVINVPKRFIYFSDLASFSSVVLTILGLYNTFLR